MCLRRTRAVVGFLGLLRPRLVAGCLCGLHRHALQPAQQTVWSIKDVPGWLAELCARVCRMPAWFGLRLVAAGAPAASECTNLKCVTRQQTLVVVYVSLSVPCCGACFGACSAVLLRTGGFLRSSSLFIRVSGMDGQSGGCCLSAPAVLNQLLISKAFTNVATAARAVLPVSKSSGGWPSCQLTPQL